MLDNFYTDDEKRFEVTGATEGCWEYHCACEQQQRIIESGNKKDTYT